MPPLACGVAVVPVMSCVCNIPATSGPATRPAAAVRMRAPEPPALRGHGDAAVVAFVLGLAVLLVTILR